MSGLIPYSNAGSMPSKRRLAQLDFDPIERLVTLYSEISSEIEYMKKLRDGLIAPIIQIFDEKAVKVNPPRYSSFAHATLLAQKERIAAELLRYGYGRIPESITINEQQTAPLIINVNDNESYTINPSEEDD